MSQVKDIWSLEDVKTLRSLRPQKPEGPFYTHLAAWIKEKRQTCTVYVDPGWSGIDVIEKANGIYIGYEVKVPRIFKEHFDFVTTVVNGIGQALHYFVRGMDLSYLVTLKVEWLDEIVSIVKEETPLGLILITKDWKKPSFIELVTARKPHIKHCKDRKTMQELLSQQKSYVPGIDILHPIK